MDISLGDVIMAFVIVVVATIIGISVVVYTTLGGGISLGRAGHAIGLFFRALTWRLIPALTSWYEQNKDRAVNRYGHDMSSEDEYWGGIEPPASGIEPLIPPSVLPRPDAANTGTWVPDRDDYSRPELLDILARQKVDNKYVFSGNKLVELFAGSPHAASRNVILDEVAKIRKGNEPEPEKRPAGARLERPSNGWGKAS